MGFYNIIPSGQGENMEKILLLVFIVSCALGVAMALDVAIVKIVGVCL